MIYQNDFFLEVSADSALDNQRYDCGLICGLISPLKYSEKLTFENFDGGVTMEVSAAMLLPDCFLLHIHFTAYFFFKNVAINRETEGLDKNS